MSLPIPETDAVASLEAKVQAMHTAIQEAHQSLEKLRSFYTSIQHLPPHSLADALASLQPFIHSP